MKEKSEKKKYEKPSIETLGSLTDLTQGGTGGGGGGGGSPPAKMGTKNDGGGAPRTRL